VHERGRKVRLAPIEFDLFRALIRNRGKMMTHRALLTEVWGPRHGGDVQALRFHVTNLRKKIQSPGRRQHYIRTEIGVGYRLVT
jgi:two-component system KDP operon response regulator KdpE